jgi:hypothetical protein
VARCGIHHTGRVALPMSGAERSSFSRKRRVFFLVTAQVWRSPPRKPSLKESGSFLKKRTKKH